MIRFMLEYREEARDELAEIWINAADRTAVTAAIGAIEEQLSVDAHLHSEIIHEDLRRIDHAPLRVYFELALDDRRVRISQVRLLPS